MKRIAFLALSVIGLSAYTASAADTTNPYREQLSRVSAAELPPKSADLIKNAKSRERTATAINVVKAAVGINPAAAPAIVGAIARAVPDMAATAAGTAAAEQPRQASVITKAAVAAAPSKAGKIVITVCRAVPNEYVAIAVAAAQAAPDSAKEIVEAVATALPELKASIEKALAGYKTLPSVQIVLSDAARIALASTSQQTAPTTVTAQGATVAASGRTAATTPANPSAARGPSIGPPYIPLSGTPGNVTPSTSGDVPTGGRNYAAP
jgi:transcription termination factor NusB